MFEAFNLDNISLTKYMFFTGKGGVGKTSTACAVAVTLADRGKNILLISTDPASNLQDIFNTDLDGKGVPIEGVPGLVIANLNPEEAAREYRESVVGPYKGLLLAVKCFAQISANNYAQHDDKTVLAWLR